MRAWRHANALCGDVDAPTVVLRRNAFRMQFEPSVPAQRLLTRPVNYDAAFPQISSRSFADKNVPTLMPTEQLHANIMGKQNPNNSCMKSNKKEFKEVNEKGIRRNDMRQFSALNNECF